MEATCDELKREAQDLAANGETKEQRQCGTLFIQLADQIIQLEQEIMDAGYDPDTFSL